MKLLLVLLFLGLVLLGALHSAHKSAFVIVHKGQPLPKHYLAKWVFGNETIVQVAPDNTVVTVAPWS